MAPVIARAAIPQYVLAQCHVGKSVEILCINGVYYINGKIAKQQKEAK